MIRIYLAVGLLAARLYLERRATARKAPVPTAPTYVGRHRPEIVGAMA